MNQTILLTNNNDDINLVNTFVTYLTSLQDSTNSFKVSRELELLTIDDIETCNGIVSLSNIYFEYNPIFEKKEAMNYSSAIIKDETYINNLLFFENDFSKSILDITITVDNIKYNSNKFIEIGTKNHYILNKI
jgi:hypothetical protein